MRCVLCGHEANKVMNGHWLCDDHHHELEYARLQRQSAVIAADIREARELQKHWERFGNR